MTCPSLHAGYRPPYKYRPPSLTATRPSIPRPSVCPSTLIIDHPRQSPSHTRVSPHTILCAPCSLHSFPLGIPPFKALGQSSPHGPLSSPSRIHPCYSVLFAGYFRLIIESPCQHPSASYLPACGPPSLLHAPSFQTFSQPVSARAALFPKTHLLTLLCPPFTVQVLRVTSLRNLRTKRSFRDSGKGGPQVIKRSRGAK